MKIWFNDALVDAPSDYLAADNWPEGFGVFEEGIYY